MRKILPSLIFLVALSIDVTSKYLAEQFLSSNFLPLLGDLIWLKLSYNMWVAFSLPIHDLPLQILTIVLIGGLIFHYFSAEYKKKSSLLDTGYALILAWALSHAYERIFVWHVTDFIAIKYFAILNFADIFISCWALLILFFYFRYEHASRL